MATPISIRALNRSKNIRIKNAEGDKVTLSPTEDTEIDLDDVEVRRALAYHAGLGNIIVSAAGFSSDAGTDIAALDTRLDAVEADVADHETRIAALEA